MKKYIQITLLTSAILFPIVSFAALGGVADLLRDFAGVLNQVKTVVFALALVYFFWGGAQFILHAGEQKTREEGRNKMLWGILALFVMLSIWGIIAWFGATIGIPVRGIQAGGGSNVGGGSSIGRGGNNSGTGATGLQDCYDSEDYWMYQAASCPE